MDGEAGWWTTSGNIGLPPLARAMGVGRQQQEIRNIIKLSPEKSCELDPLPTWLLKECIAELVPAITDIVNISLRDSLMPISLKTALIRPLLKKTGLDSDILKNYRPVSNLTFISKVIEKVVSGRLNEHSKIVCLIHCRVKIS